MPPALLADCPLDLSWPNFTLAASACSNHNERPTCCRYMNAFVAVSIARYAKTTGSLGVPLAFNDICLSSVSETLKSYGIPPNASTFCGLGQKILVSYQCEGRVSISEMLQSPNFDDVLRSCKMPLSTESRCRRCLNSDIVYLHHLIGVQDNITLSTCRDAAFVTLANRGDNFSAFDLASCFFSVQEITPLPVNASEQPSQLLGPAISPSPLTSQAPMQQHLFAKPPKEHHHAFKITLVLGIGIIVTGVAILLLIILGLLIRKKGRELKSANTPIATSRSTFPHPQVQTRQEDHCVCPSAMFRRFTYKKLRKASDNFSNIIQRGGSGTVYKARLDDGFIAVKQMNTVSVRSQVEFCREMELVGRLHHRHLVALRGFCIERHERFLIYEYMENGSLKDHLHSSEKIPLEWHTRIRIAIDVANALEYLHFYCDPPLCHNDIKSSNILLDGKFLAKVADFGLARSSKSGTFSSEPVNKVVQGTPGYIDPEYVVTQELTDKSDVYSYGVLLLELVTGRRAIQDNRNLVEWSQEFMATDSKLPELVDPRIADSFDLEQLQVVVRVILWCTAREGRARPSIRQVLRLLHERLDPLQAIEEEEGNTRMVGKGKVNREEDTIFSGDPRYLGSSSSTSRSFCSRSLLIEGSPPHSPTGV